MKQLQEVDSNSRELFSSQIKPKGDDKSFADSLRKMVKDVNQKQNAADKAINDVVEGKLGIHEGMIAIHKADISMKLLPRVRNKVMEAYKEIIRMQV